MKIRIYTDGSCLNNPGTGGWAVVIHTEHGVSSVCGSEEETTNNRMELRAVIEALKEIKKMNDKYIEEKDLSFEIFCDSAYVVNSINNGWIEKWLLNGWITTKGEGIKNKDLWLEVYEAKKILIENSIKLRIIKIKGHTGNIYNELVDKLAKEKSKKKKGR